MLNPTSGNMSWLSRATSQIPHKQLQNNQSSCMRLIRLHSTSFDFLIWGFDQQPKTGWRMKHAAIAGEKCQEQLRVYTFCSYTFTGTFCVTLCQIAWWLEYEIWSRTICKPYISEVFPCQTKKPCRRLKPFWVVARLPGCSFDTKSLELIQVPKRRQVQNLK